MSDKSYTLGLAAAAIGAIAVAGYVGFSLGQLDGLTTAANIKREQETKDWAVATMMRPLWDDYCGWFPENCECVPKREK